MKHTAIERAQKFANLSSSAVHFIIFIILDILGSTYPEVAPKH